MNQEKLIAGISVIIAIIMGISATISGILWIDATIETEKRKWFFITITCIVIIAVNWGLLDIYDYIKKKDQHEDIEYVNKRQLKIATGLLLTGGLLTVIFGFVLLYILALIPEEKLDDYIYPVGVIVWAGIILMFTSIIYTEMTDAFKTKEQKT